MVVRKRKPPRSANAQMAISTAAVNDRLRKWRRSMSGSFLRSSHTASAAIAPAATANRPRMMAARQSV